MKDLIQKAAEFARQAHESIDQRRKYTNEPYIIHPQGVADIVCTVTDDVEMICAAWLHDVVEDTPVSLEEVFNLFGPGIGTLVDELTDVATKSDGNRAARIALDHRHTASVSPRAKTVKLADVIHNLENILDTDVKFANIFVAEKKQLITVLREGDARLLQEARLSIDRCQTALEKKFGKR